MSRYTPVALRRLVKFLPLDVRCGRCGAAPGQRCRRAITRVVGRRVAGRTTQIKVSTEVTDEPCEAHMRRVQLARELSSTPR